MFAIFIKEIINILLIFFLTVPVDPVCGIELDKELATTFEHKKMTFFLLL